MRFKTEFLAAAAIGTVRLRAQIAREAAECNRQPLINHTGIWSENRPPEHSILNKTPRHRRISRDLASDLGSLPSAIVNERTSELTLEFFPRQHAGDNYALLFSLVVISVYALINMIKSAQERGKVAECQGTYIEGKNISQATNIYSMNSNNVYVVVLIYV